MGTDGTMDVLNIPLSEIEKAALHEACEKGLTAKGMMLLRRLMFELDMLRTYACPSCHRGHEIHRNTTLFINWSQQDGIRDVYTVCPHCKHRKDIEECSAT